MKYVERKAINRAIWLNNQNGLERPAKEAQELNLYQLMLEVLIASKDEILVFDKEPVGWNTLSNLINAIRDLSKPEEVADKVFEILQDCNVTILDVGWKDEPE